MIEFFTKERGISEDTLRAFGVEVEDNVVRFPYAHGTKFRKHDADGKRHFWSEPKGKALGLWWGPDEPSTGVAFLVEGESDAMRLYQELGQGVAHIVALPGLEAWSEEFRRDFDPFDIVYVVLDNEKDYKIQSRVDNCWHSIRGSLGRKAQRLVLPSDAKDLCEFFDKYTVDGLRALAESKEPLWHYEALDLTKDPGPIDWLVDNLIAKGDLALLIGEPGVGKSWLSLSLAVSVAQKDKWLGRDVDAPATRVLYVDEENAEPLVLHRMRKLGLTKEGAANIRFLHRQGIRLDRNPQLLLDEALDWEPSLIVLDSLTRMHTRDENHAGEVASLFNDGINPLARKTGATTLLLHHVTKTESPSSFARARGSGDISASIDTGLDIRQSDLQGGFNVALYKSRWIQEGQHIRAQRKDTKNGVVLEATTGKF